MDTFVLEGSKGGSGRTASSVMLAQGLAALGCDTIHLQVTLPGIPPSIAFAEGLPFKAAWLPEDTAGGDVIERILAARSDCSIAVIDMTRWGTFDRSSVGANVVTLLPMRRSPEEINVAVRDYRGEVISKRQGKTPENRLRPRGHQCSLLPITWPEGTTTYDIEKQLTRFDGPTRAGLGSPKLLMPGIPEFSRDDLNGLINGKFFQSNRPIDQAALNIARAALQLSAECRAPQRSTKSSE